MNLASTRRNWPTGRGFERFYGFLGAETNQWYPDLVYDNHPVDQPRTPEEGYHLTRGPHRQGARVHQGRQGRSRPTSRSSSTTRPARATPRTTPRRSGSTASRAVRHGLRGDARADARPPEGDGHRPARHRAAADQPDRHARDPHRPERRAVPGAGRTPARGTRCPPRRSGCSAGWPRSTPASSRTPTTRSGGCSTTWRRPASARTRWSSSSPTTAPAARAARTGRSTRTSSSTASPTTSRRTSRCSTSSAARRPTTTTPTAGRWRSTRRSRCGSATSSTAAPSDPCIISWPAGIDGQGRDPRPVPPRHRPRPDGPRRARRRAARDDQGPRPEPLRRRQHALQLRRRDAAQRPRDAVLLDARLARHLARRLEGRHHPPDAQRLEPLQRRHVGALPHRRRPLRAARPRRRGARRRLRELVNLWYAEAGANGAFPLDDRSRARDHPHAAARCSRRRATATSTTRTPPRCPSRRRSTSATAPSRSARWSTSRRPARRACCSRTARASAATRSTSRTTGCTTSTTSSASSSRRSTPTEDLPTGEDLILSAVLRQGRRGPARRRRPASCRSTTATRRSARAASRPSPASSRSPARASASDATAASRSPTTTPATAPWPFTGGTINRVAVDVSGEPYVDLEREAVAMLARE